MNPKLSPVWMFGLKRSDTMLMQCHALKLI